MVGVAETEKMNKLEKLRCRLERIGVYAEFTANYPWIYLNSVNGQPVTEKFLANHGFTAAFLNSQGELSFPDLRSLFSEIRKYV